jgi:hypothetical protein
MPCAASPVRLPMQLAGARFYKQMIVTALRGIS